jgi:hypothetical protein
MVWTAYNYQAGPKGGSLTPLLNYCTFVRIVDEGSPGLRGGPVQIQYLEGAREVPHLFSETRLIGLECGLRYTSSAGTITHADGAAGHAYENLANLKRILYGDRLMVTLQREVPHQGTVQIDVKVGAPVAPSQNRFVFLFPLVAPNPFWASTTLNSVSPTPSIAVGGDAPVHDAEITFAAGASSPILTHTASGATIQIQGTVPSGGVLVKTITGFAERVSGGTDYSEFLVNSKPYMLQLEAGATNSFTLSSGTATIAWRNKWR